MEPKLTDHVETRNHLKVRLLSTDVKASRTIAGIVTDLQCYETVLTWYSNGSLENDGKERPMDLVIIPRTAACWLLAYSLPFDNAKASFATFKTYMEACDFLSKGMYRRFALHEVTLTEDNDEMKKSSEMLAKGLRMASDESRYMYEGHWKSPPTKDFTGWAVFEKDGPYRGVGRGQIYGTIEDAQAQIRKLDAEDLKAERRIPCRFVVYATWRE